MIEYRIRTVIPKIMEGEMKKIEEKIRNIEKAISHNDPERNLRLGYCIAQNKKGIIKKISDVELEEIIDLKVFNGIINTQVKEIKKYEGKKS
jgi:exonuclease VII large subunit